MNDFDKRIKDAFEHITPDCLDSVISDCENRKGTVIVMKENRKTGRGKRIAGLAAAAAVICAAVFGVNSYNVNYAVASTVSLDVNPSIVITVNQKERVLSVTANNEDGKRIIGNMDFSGNSLDVTVNALIGSMLKNGYLTEIANSILVSVDNDDPAAGTALQEKLTAEINELLNTGAFSGSVISQVVSGDKELERLAEENGITEGKARLIKEITDNDSTHTFGELVPLSINELNVIRQSKKITSEKLETVGEASGKAYIGDDKAKQAAFAHAGVPEADVRGLEISLDYEKGVIVYEVDFEAGGVEYDYDINAATGEIVRSEKDRDIEDALKGFAGNAAQKQAPEREKKVQAPVQTEAPSQSPNAQSEVTAEQAKAAALAHAGVSAENIRGLEIDRDRDGGTDVYEIEFKSDGIEYSYEIRVSDGSVVKAEKDYD